MKSKTASSCALILSAILASCQKDKDVTTPAPAPTGTSALTDSFCGLTDFAEATAADTAAFTKRLENVTWIRDTRACYSLNGQQAEEAVQFGQPAKPDVLSGTAASIFSFNTAALACGKDYFIEVSKRQYPDPDASDRAGNEFHLSQNIKLNDYDARFLIWLNRGNGSCEVLTVGTKSGSIVAEIWMGMMRITSIEDAVTKATSAAVMKELFEDNESPYYAL